MFTRFRATITACFAVLAIVALAAQTSAAQETEHTVTFSPPDGAFSNLTVGEVVQVPWTIGVPAGRFDVNLELAVHPSLRTYIHEIRDFSSNMDEATTRFGSLDFVVNDAVVELCAQNGVVTLWARVHGTKFVDGEGAAYDKGVYVDFPCTLQGAQVSPDPSLIIHNRVCGVNNDEISAGTQPDGVGSSVSGWDSFHQAVINFFPQGNFVFPSGTQTEYVYVDDGDCLIEGQTSPVQTEICGVDNDTITLSVDDNTEGVTVQQSTEWSTDHTWTVTYIPDAGWALPADSPAEYVFTDTGPCMIAQIPPETPVAQCGPDNDSISIPDQPEGVLVTDSGWTENDRTISFAPDTAAGFAFADGTQQDYPFSDANVPCEVDPETTQVTFIFTTSDGRSIEGTEFAINTEVASQVGAPSYADGVIGPNNRVVLEQFLPGNYRLAAAPEGYAPIDFAFTVAEGEDTLEFTIDVAAVQVPTPEPTAVPTMEPTPAPTVAAPVTGLPDTGSGGGARATFISATAVMSAVTLLCLAVGQRHRRLS